MASENPTLEQLLTTAMESRLSDLNTAIPGIIQSFDPLTGLCSVQPALKREYKSGAVVNLPVVPNVPVIFPRSQNSYIYFPVKSGDSCLIVFSQRSIDTWISKGGVLAPEDERKHHISDAIVIPGLYPSSSPIPVENPESIEIKNLNTLMRLFDGKFSVKNQNSNAELVSLLVDLIQAIMDGVVAPGGGPLVNPLFALIKADLETLKE